MKPQLALIGWGVLLLGLGFSIRAEEEKANPPAAKTYKELAVGGDVPASTTWVVASEQLKKYEGKNTCLAGVNRDKKAISIYARGEGPAVWKLLKAVDDKLADRPEIKAYVVIHKSMQDEQGYNRSQERFKITQELAKKQDLKRVDVSLARGLSNRLLGEENLLRIVYSNKRNIELCESFDRMELKPEEIEAILSRIIELAQRN